MPAFPKPTFPFTYNADDEIAALRQYRDTKAGRAIPAKSANRLLLATWNIANLGLQKRRDKDYRLIAEMIGWFDLVAVQEVNDNLEGLAGILEALDAQPGGPVYQPLFSDKAGNNERTAFLFDVDKVTLLDMVGEIAIPPADHADIKLPGITRKFTGFDRNPYIAAFEMGRFNFTLANVHLFFGDETDDNMDRRSLETYAVGRWADLRRKSKNAYTDSFIALGDFNMPKAEPGDPIFRALTKRGFQLPEHTSRIASAIASDSDYDQIAFFPGGAKKRFTGKTGIFDFDGALFKELFDTKTIKQFNAYMRYYVSDHRILWAQFKTN